MAKKEVSISQGLDAILDRKKSTTTINKVESEQQTHLMHLRCDQIKTDPNQPRKRFNEKELMELTRSIANVGMLQPILVSACGDMHYCVIAGERRFRAALALGWTHVPVIVQTISEKEAMCYSIIENIQREDLDPIETANAYYRLFDYFSMSHDDIAKQVGQSRSHITNMLRLLSLPEAIKLFLAKGQLQMGHARALLSRALTSEQQIQVAEKIIDMKLSVRQVEVLVQSLKDKVIDKQSKNHTDVLNTQIPATWQTKLDRLSALLGDKQHKNLRFKLNQAGKGQIQLTVDSWQDIDALLERLET